MNQQPQPTFSGGGNIAIKIPQFRFQAMVSFYRDTLCLPYLGQYNTSHVFQFGTIRLWLDEVPNYSQVDVWLELYTDDLDTAINHLITSGTPVRNELEPLGEFHGHWISDPSGVVYLLSQSDQQQQV